MFNHIDHTERAARERYGEGSCHAVGHIQYFPPEVGSRQYREQTLGGPVPVP